MTEITKTTTTGPSLDPTKKLRFITGDKVKVFVDGEPAALTEIDVLEEIGDDGKIVTTTELYFTTKAKSDSEVDRILNL